MDLLLLSNSRAPGQEFLAHALDEIDDFLGANRRLTFVPYASSDHDGYTAVMAAALAARGITVVGVHTVADPRQEAARAEAVFVGGGNSFRLLKALYATGLLETIGDRVRAGELRYLGASAGSNMAAPTLRTTNDMPIVSPPSFETFGFVPFQINPHYLDPAPASTHMGETREERILEFLEENDVPVLGLREGAWLRVDGAVARLGGVNGARLFGRGSEPAELVPGEDASHLLSTTPRYDLTG
ncbi:dipeptidase E [Actinopolymorpha cephalotaxi]|uniref:dipeptidase E n=1 Tax=Actinopolymorpha cephalotaxi TaxID=504797 RepID=A0A1I2R535_9ACTN|nr:dipeptidase PepE [Actinopolymorpha cephalotaxi]NYH82438.1 dipeptidase E [Actinopolymorpha cephalotaxi]SFG33041.1 dipeptidase E [Actinopolymorpha cephalotaxi]